MGTPSPTDSPWVGGGVAVTQQKGVDQGCRCHGELVGMPEGAEEWA